MFALILDNKVVDIAQSIFPIVKPMKWVECNNSVKIGYFFVNKKFKSSLETDNKIIEQKKKDKISELNSYCDSEDSKEINVNIRGSDHQIINNQKTRDLLLTKLLILQNKVSSNHIEQDLAIFSFKLSQDIEVDLNISELQQITFFLDDSRQKQFKERQNHQKNIRALKNKQEIENYKIN